MVTKANGGGRGAAKDRAHDYVKRQVLTGAFPGGELISEGEVAAALGMSRTPVREAFLRLEAEGLLRLYPQRGALVVPVSSEEARAVIEARLVLEQFAARKVIGRGPRRCAQRYSSGYRRNCNGSATPPLSLTGKNSQTPTAPFTTSPFKSQETRSWPVSTHPCATVRCG